MLTDRPGRGGAAKALASLVLPSVRTGGRQQHGGHLGAKRLAINRCQARSRWTPGLAALVGQFEITTGAFASRLGVQVRSWDGMDQHRIDATAAGDMPLRRS
jgi:hypothetical protein